MTAVMLLHALKPFIQEATRTAQLGRNQEPPDVYLGHLPKQRVPGARPTGGDRPTQRDDVPKTPYVLIQLADGEDSNSDSTAKVHLVVGTYDDGTDQQGYLDVLNILEDIKQAILRAGIVDQRYEIEGKMKYIIYDNDAWPHWLGMLTTNWGFPGTEREVPGL